MEDWPAQIFWLRTIENDLRPLNLGVATAKRRAQDRSAQQVSSYSWQWPRQWQTPEWWWWWWWV